MTEVPIRYEPADPMSPADIEDIGRFGPRTNLVPARDRLLPQGEAARNIIEGLHRGTPADNALTNQAEALDTDADVLHTPLPGHIVGPQG